MRAVRHAGFTLIELLVVLVLIGIIVSFAALSIGGSGEREVEQEARRLAALIGVAGEEAVLQSKEIGILFAQDGYRFQAGIRQGLTYAWKDEDQKDPVLRPRKLPAGMSLELILDGLPVKLERVQKLEQASELPRPQASMLSSGERSQPFEVRIGVEGGARYSVKAPYLGDIKVDWVDGP
jgi:general secretion pathway protein H